MLLARTVPGTAIDGAGEVDAVARLAQVVDQGHQPTGRSSMYSLRKSCPDTQRKYSDSGHEARAGSPAEGEDEELEREGPFDADVPDRSKQVLCSLR